MGNCRSRSSAAVAPSTSKGVTVLMLGLDSSGKTTIVANLKGESTEGTTPSVGFSSSTVEEGDFQVTLYDLGGGTRLRNIWNNYYPEAWGCIFVVDSSALNRLAEAKEALGMVVQHEKMRGKPLLVLANKQDCEGAMWPDQVGHQLDLTSLLEESGAVSCVLKCTALKSANGNRTDPNLRQGLRWLGRAFTADYRRLSERVNADMAEQKVVEAQKRRERAERVKKIREERERQQRLAGVTDEEGEEGEEEADGGDPFKPIKQAAVETEARERAAKAKRKEIQKRLSHLQDSSETDPLSITPAQSGIEQSRFNDPDDDGRSLSSVGLSSSSDSLTDVTPASHASTESLHSSTHPPLPLDPVVTVQTGPLPVHQSTSDPTASTSQQVGEGGGKRKKKKRSTLLSRLKNRSKTAPMPSDMTSEGHMITHTAPHPFSSSVSAQVSRNTWTTGDLEPVSSATPDVEHQALSPAEDTQPSVTVSTQPPVTGDSQPLITEDTQPLITEDTQPPSVELPGTAQPSEDTQPPNTEDTQPPSTEDTHTEDTQPPNTEPPSTEDVQPHEDTQSPTKEGIPEHEDTQSPTTEILIAEAQSQPLTQDIQPPSQDIQPPSQDSQPPTTEHTPEGSQSPITTQGQMQDQSLSGSVLVNPHTASSSSLRKASLHSLSSSPPLSLRGENMQGLPELPPRSRVILPPLQITKQPVGVTDVLHTEEEVAAIPKDAIKELSEPPSLPVAV